MAKGAILVAWAIVKQRSVSTGPTWSDTKGIQPLDQASADHILNHLDNVLHLFIALAVAGCRILVHDAEYLA